MKTNRIPALPALATGAMIMCAIFGCSGSAKFSAYSSKDPAFKARCDIPAGWITSESRGSEQSYVELAFLQPGEGPRAMMYVRQFEPGKGTVAKTPDAFIEDLVQKKLRLPRSKVLARTQVSFQGGKAIELVFSYEMPEKLYAPGTAMLALKEKTLVFEKAGKIYSFGYANRDPEFPVFEKAFRRLLTSLKLGS